MRRDVLPAGVIERAVEAGNDDRARRQRSNGTHEIDGGGHGASHARDDHGIARRGARQSFGFGADEAIAALRR